MKPTDFKSQQDITKKERESWPEEKQEGMRKEFEKMNEKKTHTEQNRISQPDDNCHTLPDGSCIGKYCMHDPQPSAGAIQAAEILYLKLFDSGDQMRLRLAVGDTTDTAPIIEEMATIIDRETKLPEFEELLEAAKDIIMVASKPTTNGNIIMSEGMIIALQSGITHIEGQEEKQ